jgi:hypothetical protein
MAELEKMAIMPCTLDTEGNIDTIKESAKIKVMLNPASFKHNHSISYTQDKAVGKSGEELKFNRYNAEEVSFELIFDGTGVVPESFRSVREQIDKLKNVIYKYQGSPHQPDPSCLSWGSFWFVGRLASLSIDYTLFKPGGEPLRAKVNLSFRGYVSKEEEAKKANKNSPDLTHTIEVKAGDTLPLLCYQVYRDTSYYPDVARINGLNSLQELRPGLKLKFPPLR